jgi:hypothetical protein
MPAAIQTHPPAPDRAPLGSSKSTPHASRDSTVADLQVTLRRLADEYQTIANELEDDEISDKLSVD